MKIDGISSSYLEVDNYAVLREALENNEGRVLPFPLTAEYEFSAINRPRMKNFLDRLELSWHEDEEHKLHLTIYCEAEARRYVSFAEKLDYEKAVHKAEEAIRLQKKAARANFFRRIFFRKPVAVPFEGQNCEQIARSLMAV